MDDQMRNRYLLEIRDMLQGLGFDCWRPYKRFAMEEDKAVAQAQTILGAYDFIGVKPGCKVMLARLLELEDRGPELGACASVEYEPSNVQVLAFQRLEHKQYKLCLNDPAHGWAYYMSHKEGRTYVLPLEEILVKHGAMPKRKPRGQVRLI